MSAARLRRRSHVTAAVRPAISRAIAPTPLEAALEVWGADTLVVPAAEARNATSAERSAISLATVLKVVLEATEVVDTAEVAMGGDTEAVAHNRLATLAAATGTCLATAPRVRNATTVSPRDQSSSSKLTETYRRRGRSSQSRLSLGAHVGTCLL